MTGKLRLKADNGEDIGVIAACLQDAVIVVRDLAYLPSRRSFAAMFARFKWEEDSGYGLSHRILAGLHVNHVLSVQTQDIPLDEDRHVLDLLTIGCEEHDDAAATITLIFADGGAVRLEVECIEAYLRDVGEPWTTPRKPKHTLPVDRDEGSGP